MPSREASTRAYANSGLTATATFAGRVHGVVVHITMYSFSLPVTGNLTNMEGSVSSQYSDLGIGDRSGATAGTS